MGAISVTKKVIGTGKKIKAAIDAQPRCHGGCGKAVKAGFNVCGKPRCSQKVADGWG